MNENRFFCFHHARRIVFRLITGNRDPRAVMTIADGSCHLSPGYASEIETLAAHGAFNGGTAVRIHFIFEVFEDAGRHMSILETGA